jgi:hypothetical protein
LLIGSQAFIAISASAYLCRLRTLHVTAAVSQTRTMQAVRLIWADFAE